MAREWDHREHARSGNKSFGDKTAKLFSYIAVLSPLFDIELFAYVRVKRYESYGNWIWQNLVGEERQKIKLKSIHRNWRLSLGLLTPHAQYFILLWRWKLNNQSFLLFFCRSVTFCVLKIAARVLLLLEGQKSSRTASKVIYVSYFLSSRLGWEGWIEKSHTSRLRAWRIPFSL